MQLLSLTASQIRPEISSSVERPEDGMKLGMVGSFWLRPETPPTSSSNSLGLTIVPLRAPLTRVKRILFVWSMIHAEPIPSLPVDAEIDKWAFAELSPMTLATSLKSEANVVNQGWQLALWATLPKGKEKVSRTETKPSKCLNKYILLVFLQRFVVDLMLKEGD